MHLCGLDGHFPRKRLSLSTANLILMIFRCEILVPSWLCCLIKLHTRNDLNSRAFDGFFCYFWDPWPVSSPHFSLICIHHINVHAAALTGNNSETGSLQRRDRKKDFYLRQTGCFHCCSASCVLLELNKVIFEGGLSRRFINNHHLDPRPADLFIFSIISLSSFHNPIQII